MKCPIARYECTLVEVRHGQYPLLGYQCVEHGSITYWLLTPDAMKQFEAEWREAKAIIAAANGDAEYGGDGR